MAKGCLPREHFETKLEKRSWKIHHSSGFWKVQHFVSHWHYGHSIQPLSDTTSVNVAHKLLISKVFSPNLHGLDWPSRPKSGLAIAQPVVPALPALATDAVGMSTCSNMMIRLTHPCFQNVVHRADDFSCQSLAVAMATTSLKREVGIRTVCDPVTWHHQQETRFTKKRL